MSTKKRVDGEGSLYQRKDGKWVTTISLGFDHTGKRKRRSRVSNTRNEAVKKLRDLQAEAAEGPALVDEHITLTKWCHQWCETIAPLTAKASTVADYRWTLDHYVLPHIGHLKVRALTPQHCAQLQQKLLNAGLSPNTVRHARRPLSAALTQAERDLLIRFNPLRSIRQPRIDKTGFDKVNVLTRDQAQLLLDAAKQVDPILHGVVVLGVCRGARRGEILGLRWQDVDLEKGIIHIRQQLREERREARGGGYVVELRTGPPKTKKSRRDLTIDSRIASALKRIHLQQAKWRLACGPDWVDSGFVFTTKNGDPRYPSNVYAQYKKLLKQTGLPDITLHDLRRTWATLSVEAGVRIEQAQEALGHESIETTKNIYVTAVPALARRAFETFDEYFTAQKSSDLRLVEKEPF